MKRILTTTTAFSVALAGIGPLPLLAQTRTTLADQGIVCISAPERDCPEGVMCLVIPEPPCDDAAEIEAALQAEAEAEADSANADKPRTRAERAAAQAARAAAKAEREAAQAAKAAARTDKAAAQAATKAASDEAGAARIAAEKAEAVRKAAAARDARVAARTEAKEAAAALEQILTSPDDGETPVAAAAGDADAGAPADTETTTVTEADSRSSAEDFSTTATPAPAGTVARERSGLSDLEKFGLVVLGGLVVGAVLNNGDKVVSNTGDRVVIEDTAGNHTVLRDDDTLIRRPGSNVSTRTYADGSTRSVVARNDGSRIITVRDASGRVLKRERIDADGRATVLLDDLTPVEPINVSTLPRPVPLEPHVANRDDRAALRAALQAAQARDLGRSFSLRQIREYRQVRALAPMIDVASITFRTGSAAIDVTEADKLSRLGNMMAELVAANPSEMFLIEGHTDAVGSAASNLALSDRRAESVALALSEYFLVPPENMVVQGYGESELRIPTEAGEPLNRRAAVRLISPLLRQMAAN